MNAKTPNPRKSALSLLALLALACAAAPSAGAQVEVRRPPDRAVARVQEAVRARILSDRGGRDEYVVFNDDAARAHLPRNQILIAGTGTYYRDGRGGRERREEFRYSAAYSPRDNRVERIEYHFGEGRGRAEVPRWLVGTFRGRAPSGRQRALVTVEENGTVSVAYGDGKRERGTYADRQLRLGTSVWNVSRNNDGFRAQDEATRRAEDFVRAEGGGRVDDDDTGDGRVPRWAVGTFRGTTDSGESELTIHRDGTATATSLKSHTMFMGRYADGVLTFDWGSYRVEREGEGIRTVQLNNRRNQTSYRRVN